MPLEPCLEQVGAECLRHEFGDGRRFLSGGREAMQVHHAPRRARGRGRVGVAHTLGHGRVEHASLLFPLCEPCGQRGKVAWHARLNGRHVRLTHTRTRAGEHSDQ